MLQSNITFYLKGLISPTLWVWQTFNISNDLELWLPVDTDGETVSIVFKNQRQTERMTVTISESVCTIVKRGIEQTGGVASAGLQKEWTEWVTGYITALDFDLLDKDWDTNTVSSNITYSGDNTSTWSFDMQWEFKLPVFADSTARDLVYTSPVEWDKCIITGTGEQYYEGWAWNTLWVGTPTPNGSTTVAGKFQSATPTERASWDTTWSTWALLIPTNDALVKTPDVTPANDENKIPVLNSGWKVDDFVSKQDTYSEESTIVDNDTIGFYDTSASDVKKIQFSNLTSAIQDKISDIFLHFWSRSTADATWAEIIAHGLGRVPNIVDISYCEAQSNSSVNGSFNWYSNWVDDYTIGLVSGAIDGRDDTCLYYHSGTTWWSATITLDVTNITINWTKIGSGRNLDFILKAK